MYVNSSQSRERHLCIHSVQDFCFLFLFLFLFCWHETEVEQGERDMRWEPCAIFMTLWAHLLQEGEMCLKVVQVSVCCPSLKWRKRSFHINPQNTCRQVNARWSKKTKSKRHFKNNWNSFVVMIIFTTAGNLYLPIPVSRKTRWLSFIINFSYGLFSFIIFFIISTV